MAKVKIQGHASGSGVLTVTAPNTSSDRTITLPDATGTLLTEVADDAITLAKMASGTDGNIISYDASGNPVAVATGNAGQVLTSAGAGAPPTFAASNTPNFLVSKTDGSQSYSDNTVTKCTFNNEIVDSDSAYASDKFTVPAGEGGMYYFLTHLTMGVIADNANYYNYFYKNGSVELPTLTSYNTTESEYPVFSSCLIMNLSAADYIEVYGKTNGGGSNFQNDLCFFAGFKIG